MPYDSSKHHRRSIRLKGYDYRQSGVYFITPCTNDRSHLFGEIVNAEMQLTTAGQIVMDHWLQLPEHYPGVDVDAFIVMPNHFHGLIVLGKPQTRSLGQIIGAFKSFSNHAICMANNTPEQTIWQRNYYERIVVNETMLNAIRDYIENNPANWVKDPEYREPS